MEDDDGPAAPSYCPTSPAYSPAHVPTSTASSGPLDTDNWDNSVERWRNALKELQAEPPLTPPERHFDLDVIVALDVSASMGGVRINAVKLGLCCLLGALRPADRVHLLTFDSEIRDVIGGPLSAAELLPTLPGLLAGIRADGGTRFYDAILACFDVATASRDSGGTDAERMAAGTTSAAPPVSAVVEVTADAASDDASAPASDPTPTSTPAPAAAASVASPKRRTAILTLTDGEDTYSEATEGLVQARIRRPGSDHLMFIAVTVDVNRGMLTRLEPWFVYSHSKRMDVTVKTGRRLVALFAETVLLRMLRDDDASALSLYSRARGAVLRDGCFEPNPLGAGAAPARAMRYAPTSSNYTPTSPNYAPTSPIGGSASDSSSGCEDANVAGRRVRARVASNWNVPAAADDGDDGEIDNNGCHSPAYACYDSE